MIEQYQFFTREVAAGNPAMRPALHFGWKRNGPGSVPRDSLPERFRDQLKACRQAYPQVGIVMFNPEDVPSHLRVMDGYKSVAEAVEAFQDDCLWVIDMIRNECDLR